MERSHMQRAKLNFDKVHWVNFPKLAAVGMLWMGCFSALSLAQQPGQKLFSSAEEASSALVTAAQNNDEKAMLDILGPNGKQLVSSGDETEDAQSRANFVECYQAMHRLVKEPDRTTNTPRKSSVRKGSTMAFIGKLLMANPRALSDRWWRRLFLRAMRKAET